MWSQAPITANIFCSLSNGVLLNLPCGKELPPISSSRGYGPMLLNGIGIVSRLPFTSGSTGLCCARLRFPFASPLPLCQVTSSHRTRYGFPVLLTNTFAKYQRRAAWKTEEWAQRNDYNPFVCPHSFVKSARISLRRNRPGSRACEARFQSAAAVLCLGQSSRSYGNGRLERQPCQRRLYKYRHWFQPIEARMYNTTS